MPSKTDRMRVIHDEILALSVSPLYAYRVASCHLPVIGEGSHDASLMFVGEAPGRNEAKTGRPFCGAAGKILDELLATIPLPRCDVYITNIVKDRPPQNRDPLPEEIGIYGPFLDRQIDIIEPRVIVPLGRYAMGYLMRRFGLELDLEPISRAHGKTYEARAPYGALHIVPQYHPAAAIYNQDLKGTLSADFQALRLFAT